MSGPGPGPGGRGGWSPVYFRPCSPYGPSPPPRLGSPGANMIGSQLPHHMACPRPRWPGAMSPVPRGVSPPPSGPRPFRVPMHPPSPAPNRCASPEYFRGVHAWSPSPSGPPTRGYEYVGVPLEPPPLPHNYDPDEEESGPSTAEIIANQSQDYIDEKLAEYQMTIYQLQDEQERVQKKTFVNWINSYLSKRVPPLRVDDLIEDLKDGTKLLALLEVLAGEKLPVERGRILRRPHFLSNANTALQFLQNKRIKLVNINASDLVDGRPPVVLGLIWTIILYFQIEENSRALEYLALWGSQSSLESAGTTASRDRWKMGARKTLLNWVANALPRDSGIEVRDFGASWRDGIAFLAIIDAIKKNIVDIASLKRENNRTRLETAFDVAESELGITRLLDPEDVDVPKPDEKSIMTYVAQFLHKYPEPGSGQPDVILTIQEQYGELLTWLRQKTQYLEHLQQTGSLSPDFKEYLAFKSEVDEREKLYTKLKQLIESQSLVTVTRESWIDIITLWEKLQRQLLQWLWLIDSHLPGDFKFIGEWLAAAEKLIYCDDLPTVMNDETAAVISRKLEEHKSFFADYPSVKQKFVECCSTPLAEKVPSDKLHNLNIRLNEIGPKSSQRRVRLKFLEHKCCLIAFLQLTESKLKIWTAKYGRLDKVMPLLDQYRNFVSKNNIFQEFNKAFIDMKAVIQEYKQDGNISKREKEDTDLFISEIADRWKNVSMELRCVQSMLEEVAAYWKRWDPLVLEFENWLSKAENALNLSEDEKIEFFQDITVWRDNYQLLGDTVSFLIATCNDKIAIELKDQYQAITARWEKIFPHVNKYSHSGDLLRNRKDFKSGIEMLSQWLRKAENIVNSPQLGSTERIIEHIEKLVKLQGEIEDIESVFKSISKTFQSLIQDLSRDEVEKMMILLKQEKEALVKIRALIPAQIHLFNQLLIQQRSLEDGQKEINSWLDNAENLLGNLTLVCERDVLKSNLEKVKQFFTRTLYYKSMLDSKNKVMNNIIKTVDQNKNSDVAQMVEKMDQLNDRFTYVTQNAQVWEQRFQETIRCLYNFTECHRIIANWLGQAERLIDERRIDNKEIVEEHKNFFTSVNEKWIHDLIQHSQDLCNCLPKEQHKPILNSVSELQGKWKQVLSFAPLHLMKLEFRLDETTFNFYVKELEKEIHSEHLSFSKQSNVSSIISRNKEYFSGQGPVAEAEQCLKNLKTIAQHYTLNNPDDTSIQKAFEHAEKQWKTINTKIENLNKELKQIPEKWDEYHKKFEEIIVWMDHVDESLKQILTSCQTFEEFDDQKLKFQEICEQADSKRYDMKWLVQTLDSLVSQCTPSQAEIEQKNLDQLLLRYKNLIPSLEITMTKTDTLSKCYSYRREVHEVCELLKKVRDIRAETPQPNNLPQLINIQESTLSHLDSQRPSIMSVLQKGKELEKDINAPQFVQEEVENLEKHWTETYRYAVDRLNQLKETHQSWTSYENQKKEIQMLLLKAEQQLKDIHPSQYNLSTLTVELKKKQQEAIKLREKIEEMLRRLYEFSVDLGDHAPVLQKEIHDIEQRFHSTLESAQKNIITLEQYTVRMNSFQNQLSNLQEWTLSKAPVLLASVQQEDISPQEKIVKTEKLQKEIIHNITLLNSLDNEVQEIQVYPEEAPKLQSQILELRERVEAVNKDAESQKAVISQDLKNWEACLAILQDAKPWLEKSEEIIQKGLKKPLTLEEALKLKAENDEFAKECQIYSKKLQGVLTLSHQLSSKSPAQDEIDSSITKHTIIYDMAHQWDRKLDKLVANWETFNSNLKSLETSIQKGEHYFAEHDINPNTREIDKLDKKLSELRMFNNELSEQQAKVISLSQNLDAISYYIAPEGLNLNKTKLQEMKTRINRLVEQVRGGINTCSDAILVRYKSQARINNFATWIYDFKNNISQLDEVSSENLDSALMDVHVFLQEHSEKSTVFNDIYEEIKEMALRTTGDDSELLNSEYTKLSKNYEDVRENLLNKKKTLDKWLEFMNWHKESLNQLQHLNYQIENENTPQNMLELALPEINSTITKLQSWKNKIPEIDNLKHVTIIDKQSGLPISAEKLLREIEIKLVHLKSSIEQRIKKFSDIKIHWQTFHKIEESLLGNLKDLKDRSNDVFSIIQQPSDLVAALDKINKLAEEQAKNNVLKEELRAEGLYLTKEDIQNVSMIQNVISQVETESNNVVEHVRNQKLMISQALSGWKDFQDAKNRVSKDISDLNESIQNFDTPNDLLQATVNCEKGKKLLEAFKRFKITLDKLEGKGQSVIKNCDIPVLTAEIKNDIQEISQSWSSIYEKILNLLQKTESQATIWRDIDSTKNDLIKWLNEQNNIFVAALDKPNEVEEAKLKLKKYKEELPLYSRLKQSLPIKYSQITKLSNEEISPIQVLIQIIDDQFEMVETNANKLDTLSANFGQAKVDIQEKIRTINSKIGNLREQIIKCEDLGGDNKQIVQRVLKIQDLKKSLLEYETDIKDLEHSIKQIKIHYPNLIEGVFPKEQQLIKKRYDDLITHSNKIENSLLGFLKKIHAEKYGVLQRVILTQKEKINWCSPDNLCDKYSLEIKLKSLMPIISTIEECEEKKLELEDSLQLLTKVEHPEVIKLLTAEKDHLNLEINDLKNNFDNTKCLLENTIELHKRYDEMAENISTWLKEKENDVKLASSVQLNLDDLNESLEKIEILNTEVVNYDKEIDELKPISEKLTQKSSDERITQYVEHLSTRYIALKEFLSNYIRKMNELKNYSQRYRQSVQAIEEWLKNTEQKVANLTQLSTKPDQNTLKKLKDFMVEKEDGRVLLNNALESGEALFPGITPDNRETIRNELRVLRGKAEELIETVNKLYKNIETTLTQKHSFEESLDRFKVWMDEADDRIGEEYKLDNTLAEKKETLHNFKILSHDADLHFAILSKLKTKISDLDDSEVQLLLKDNILRCENLMSVVRDHRNKADSFVRQHENFDSNIENCRNWLNALTSESLLLMDESLSDTADSKSSMIQDLLSQKDQGDQRIETCKKELQVTLQQTAEGGHPALVKAFNEQEEAWKSFLNFCTNAQEKLDSLTSQYSKLDQIIESMEDWLKLKDNQVRDQSLKSSEEAKRDHLQKLIDLNEEILSKVNDFKDLAKEYSNIDASLKIPTLNSKYETLKNTVREAIKKYELYVEEHKSFNQEYNSFVHWLTEKVEDLQGLSHIVSDMAVLRNRNKDTEVLVEDRNKKSAEFDDLLQKGEKLYSHTSPDGREIIRQQLKNLRTIWDSFADDLQNTSYKLDQCLVQFSDFTMAQEQLTKWLKDVEKALQQHTELKATLQEKRAQFQNHKIMHQEIMSHQQLVEAVCDKAQKLVDETQDKSLNAYLQSIKQLFVNIVNQSEELLNNLDACVKVHIDFNDSVNSFKDWLRGVKEKLQEHYETSGSKHDIEKRVVVINTTKDINRDEGKGLLGIIKEKLIMTAKSTAPAGVDVIKSELEELHSLLDDYLSEVDHCLERQNNVYKEWERFDNTYNELTNWCKSTEIELREQPLQDTLSDKIEKCKSFLDKKEVILNKEAEVDQFIDFAHNLAQTSGVQRIQTLVSQLNTRYQQLQGLARDIVTRWQIIADDHKNYHNKLQDTNSWLNQLEEGLANLKSGKTEDPLKRLPLILAEKDQGEHKVNDLTLIGERLLPDTATQGRETIRNELRVVRERWDKLLEDVKHYQKNQEVQTQQLTSYRDILQQTLTWLSSMEKNIQLNPSQWNSVQEIRSKLLKHKTLNQEILGQRKIIEDVTSKARNLLQFANNVEKVGPVEDQILSINERYEVLVKNSQMNIKKLEDFLDLYHQFYELQKSHQDLQKQQWDKLNNLNDLTGGKEILQERENQLAYLQDNITENSLKIKDLETFVRDKIGLLPARIQEQMQRDVSNLSYDQSKFISALADVKSNLEARLAQWNDFENNLDRLLSSLNDTEIVLKNYIPKSTAEEKLEQLEKYQALVSNLSQTEKDIDKLSDDINELVHNSGDSRVSVNIQQITSRFQAIQLASREILKRCEQAYTDHKFFDEKYRQCVDWIDAAAAKFDAYEKSVELGSKDILSKESNILQELLAEEVSANLLLNNVIELGEKLYPNTSTDGEEILKIVLISLQESMEGLFDNLKCADRSLKSNLTRWSSFDESMNKLTDWLKNIEDNLSELKLWSTIDEKKEQHEKYKKINNEIVNYKENIAELKEKLKILPNSKETVESEILELSEKYQVLLKRAQEFVESYELIVNDHFQFDKAVSEAKSWLENTQNVISNCNDSSLDNTNLRTNLDKLKHIKASLRDEESKILSVKTLADRVINQSRESARPHIQSIVEDIQAELAKLLSFLDVSIDQLQTKINSWDEYDKFRDHCLEWLRKSDAEVHSIDLKSTAVEKKTQLDRLKVLHGEIRAKELEIDQVTEKAQQLTKGANKRNSQISEIEAKYQQVSQRVKDTTTKWQQFVADHEDLDARIVVLDEWLQDLKTKLSDCENIKNSTRREIERKVGIVQEISLKKEDGFKRIQALVELAQTVLGNTASSGHATINDEVTRLQEDWSAIASRMIETKNILDNAISKWTSIIQDIQDLSKAIEWMKAQIAEHSVLTGTMSEKKSQLDAIKQIEEKVRCDKIEVDNLRHTASNIFDSRQGEDISNCQHILDEYDECVQKIQKLLKDRECQFRDHKAYKEAYDELQRWMTRAQEKVPQLKQRPLSDKLSIENFSGPLDHLLNKKAQGEILIEHLEHTAQVILPNTSEIGQENINNDIRALKEAFERLFKDIKEQREQLEVVLEHWREYKDEYERISDWLQQLTILIKNQKIALCPNLEEKKKQVETVKDLLKKMQDGKEQIDALNDSAKILLKSPLETYVNNQLQQLNSRYEVEVNLAADVLKKIENNYKQHKEYSENLEKSRNWIDNAKELIKNCSETSSLTSKDVLQTHLNKLQNLFQERENGQSLIHATVNCGEKVLRNTRSDGKEVINAELKEIQNDWERVVKKMSSAKVHLETALLQWADYDSSYNQLQQWITDREAKLQKVTVVKLTKTGKSGLDALPIGERRATLRETGSIMQDIVSFEPMIQSVTSKAEDLKQAAPASEISSKYEILSKQAQAIYAKQKETIDSHQAFIDAGNDFVQWIRLARERLGKCSDPTGDKESLGSKLSQIKALINELPEGQNKLEFALEKGDKACQYADDDDREIIEEEVGLLQDEFDSYSEMLTNTKTLLEVGLVKWTEYEEQYQEALKWLSKKEEKIKVFNKLQSSLEDKRAVLEQFQLHLQTLFDWQSELDRLNMKAQVLLETCSDTRISNGVTQLATKYGTILALAKEIMRRLELHYQEHQQHSTLCQECQDWLDRTKEKLNSCHEIPNILSEINNKLQILKNIRTSIEQGQNKLRYILELKERVIVNTEKSGAEKIEEGTENLKQDIEKLLSSLNDARNKLTVRGTQLEDIEKLYKIISEVLDDIDHQLPPQEEYLQDLGEKKSNLEKFKTLYKELKAQNELVAKLKTKLNENDVADQNYQNCIQRYDKMVSYIEEMTQNLDKQVAEHQQYKNMYEKTTAWIKERQTAVQNCTNLHAELNDIEDKENAIDEIIKILPQGEDFVHSTIEMSILVLKSTGAEGQDIIKQDIDELNNVWEGFQVLCTETKKSLVRCREAWIEFNDICDKFEAWINVYGNKLDDLNKKEKYDTTDLSLIKDLLDEIDGQKENLETLTDACDLVMGQSAVGWVRDKTVELQNTYTVMLTNTQDLLSKIEKSLSDHNEFLMAKSNLEQWLFKAHSTIQECIGVGDEAAIEEKLELIAQSFGNMGEGQELLSALQEAFAKAINVVPINQQESLRTDVSALRNSWDQLNLDLTSIQAQLKAALNRWKEYNDSKQSLMVWMSNTEDILDDKHSTRGEYSEMKTLLERYKNLGVEIANKRNHLDRFKKEAIELGQWSKNPTVSKNADEIQLLYDNLLSKCNRRKENVEAEIRDYTIYQQSLQEVEKWLLQTSFKLMNQNALYITNKVQTENQLREQESTINEIQKFQTNLDDARAKGQKQIDQYIASTPTIEETIGKQLNNVQDSFNSLLKTALQIKNRLLESLSKFEEYEATLEDIMRNLDQYEPKISEITDKSVDDLDEGQLHLEIVKDMHEKLQGEKTRLALAVQACESAASMSRPGSPRDVHPPSVPTKELECRARLGDAIDQDITDSSESDSPSEISLLFDHLEEPGLLMKLNPLINKVQTYLGQLTSTIAELQEREKLKEDLKRWIETQRTLVNDWKNKPTKLRPDGIKQDLGIMNELLLTIGQRKQQLLTDFHSSNVSELENLLDSLEAELCELIAQRQMHQELIEEYRHNLQGVNNWYDSLSKQIEAIDKGFWLHCQQKQSTLLEIKAEFDENSPNKIDEVKTLAATIISIVNNLDSQLIEEQMKSLEKKHAEVQRRLQRKLEVIEIMQKVLDEMKTEINNAREWVKSNLADLRKQEPIGFEVYKADDRLNALKSLLKETHNKTVLRDTLLKRVNNMVNELEPSEKSQLENDLKNLKTDQEELIECLRKEIDKTVAIGNTRRTLESSMEKAKAWLPAKSAEVRKLSGYLQLQSSEIKREIDQQQAYEAEIKVFGNSDLNDLLKLGNSVLKECNAEDKKRLQSLLDEIKDDYENLKQEANQKIRALTDLFNGRKQFEFDINKCINWLKEADVATKSEIRAPNLENLEEQLTKYLKLLGESGDVQNDIDKIVEQSKAIVPTISESDKYSLNQTLEDMKDWHKRIAELIKDRTEALKQNILQLRDAKNKISESIQFINNIEAQLKELNKPIGSKVEDVKSVLSIYENILKDLKANKEKLSDVPSSEELNNILTTQDELIRSIEDQISRLRQLLLLREQFIALITEIMTFITKYTEIIRDIEKTGGTIEDKIKKYDDVIVRIQECEAILASAYDKGQQIAADCSVQDQNSITEQLQSLKNSLLTLRRAVEKQRQEHENTAAEHKKLAAALEEILDLLHSEEGKAKSRPLLKRSVDSVDKEIEEHKGFAKEILKSLDKIRSIQQAAKHDDSMPSALLEQLSEANSLLTHLPQDLDEREKYLLLNRELREKYESLKNKFFDWIKEAEIRLESFKEGVDFQNILTDLEEHKIFFSTEGNMKELVTLHIQKAADEIWPSLTSSEQEELSRERQHLTQTLKNTLNSAKSQRAQLEQGAEIWKEYSQSLDKVKSVIARTKFVDEPVSTLAGLHFNIQKISHALNDIQNQQQELDLLSQRVAEIIQQADKNNKRNIEAQSGEVSNQWSSLVSDLENRRETLTKLAQVWETFEGRWQNFESLLTGIEEKTKHIETVVRNKEHVISTKRLIEDLQSEADSLESYKEEIDELSKNVVFFLNSVSKTSSNVLTEKLAQLDKTYKGLKENLSNRKAQVLADLERIEKCLALISEKKNSLHILREEVEQFYVFDQDTSKTEEQLAELQSRIESEVLSSKNLSRDIRETYKTQGLLPSDIAQELNQLELLGETVLNNMEEKNREFKKARTVRTDYLNDVEEVQLWIKEAELKLQDRSVEPQKLHENLQQIHSEIAGVSDQLEKLTKNGKIIAEKTKDEKEKHVILSTISELYEQMQQIKSLLEEKRQQVGDTLDAWQRFLALYQAVMSWVEEKKVFLKEALYITTLQEAKQKLHDYNNAVKSCKVASKNLSDMVKELENIGNVTSVGDLPKKMEEAEEAKVEVEAQIVERNGLLQETSEEWEQCEKKMKDVKNWIEKIRKDLESQQNKKKALRDQHALREKMLADIHIQKTKISLSVEKLQLHFRAGISGDAKVTQSAQELLCDLDDLNETIKQETVQLETAISQVDQYQSEVQQLRQQIVQVEQQLRTATTPVHLAEDREQALREQQMYKDRLRTLQSKMSARNERMKLIVQRGTPDTGHLDT